MADQSLEYSLCLQMDKGLGIRLACASAVRLVGQIVDTPFRVVLRPSDRFKPLPALRIGADESALEPVAVVGNLLCPNDVAVIVQPKRYPHLQFVFLVQSLVMTIGRVFSLLNSKRCAAPPNRGRLEEDLFLSKEGKKRDSVKI